jgi:hypothetical protein
MCCRFKKLNYNKMKKLISKINRALIAILLLATSVASAQGNSIAKTDKVTFLNGIIKEGKVTNYANEKIQFIHYGETLKYEFSRNEIEKIEYASGRTEQLAIRKPVVAEMFTPVNSRNRVAVLPLTYIGDGNDDRSDEMRFQLQNITISFLHSSAAELRFMDAAEINALLLKKGINDETIRQYTPKELANLLKVEYIIMGSVLQDEGSVVTTNNSYTNRRQNVDHRHYDRRYYDRGRGNTRTYRNERSVTRQNIETQVSISIYNETGESVYTKSRHSILSESDAYRNALHYLLKRCPLYNR